MADLAELEQRIAAALARISAGVDRWRSEIDSDGAPMLQGELARLQTELDTERTARAAADTALSDMQMPGDHTAEVDRLTRALDAQGLDNQRLRSSIAQLREELRRMVAALEDGSTDAPLINRALQAEVDSLRAVRASETTEMADILAALTPIIEAEEARTDA